MVWRRGIHKYQIKNDKTKYQYGKAESTGALIVKQGPSFNTGVKPNPRVIAIMGEDVELRCKAEASPLLDMAYTWKLNGKT
mgnify:CR=1 FL=1